MKKNKAEMAVNSAKVMLMPPLPDAAERGAARDEAVAILRSSLVHLMRGDSPQIAEKVFNLIIDIESGK
ncbi:TPA: hypothetical protein QA377_004326 [Raoultella ornithinolytica]|nr:hypothetical protein [Raoultella ornithinolytica]